jgi:ligand-binding SRPBCC domain-containing protein
MAIYTFTRRQVVAMPLEQCWRFFSDPRNLSKITPPDLRFIVRSDLPEEIHAGLMIRYTVSPLWSIPMSWLTEITQVEKPHYFVDEQRVGPYRIWHHEHFFRSLADGRTEVRDLVHYVPPLGPLGALVEPLMIRPQLERIFDFREQQLTAIAAQKPDHSFA